MVKLQAPISMSAPHVATSLAMIYHCCAHVRPLHQLSETDSAAMGLAFLAFQKVSWLT